MRFNRPVSRLNTDLYRFGQLLFQPDQGDHSFVKSVNAFGFRDAQPLFVADVKYGIPDAGFFSPRSPDLET